MRHSKAFVPERPPHFVERDEVRNALDDQSVSAGPGRVVLVSAPTGYGKPAAVADWVRASADVPTVWVSLDESDRDEAGWWRSVLGALAQSPGVPQDSALQRLRMPSSGGERWAREAFVVTVLEAIEGLPGPVRLVFDDVHEIVGHPTERALRALVRHPVQGLTLVLCSRVADPRLRRAVDRIRRMIEERGGSVSLHGRPGGGPGAAVVGRSSKSRLVIIGGFLPGGLSPPPRPVRPDLAE